MKEKEVRVEWEDAAYNSGYYDKSEPALYEQILTKTRGVVIKSDAKQIILGTDSWLDINKEIQYRHISTIPRKMIKKITYLRGE